jgi:Sulfatase-modifying factor enzyme 1
MRAIDKPLNCPTSLILATLIFMGCAPCIDNDGDGYGLNPSVQCGGGVLVDCDDEDENIHPGALEGPLGDPTCSDGAHNNCDGHVDLEDRGCAVAQIPAGCFEMGDAFDEGYDDELPVHNICVSGFEMDAHEVTNGEYAAFVDAGFCSAPANSISHTRASYYGNDTYRDFPVIYVSWFQAGE